MIFLTTYGSTVKNDRSTYMSATLQIQYLRVNLKKEDKKFKLLTKKAASQISRMQWTPTVLANSAHHNKVSAT